MSYDFSRVASHPGMTTTVPENAGWRPRIFGTKVLFLVFRCPGKENRKLVTLAFSQLYQDFE